ncbi:hypothetical protein GWK08_17295 [Leptobacterium flavescens]|uniref:Transglutaminase-like domain-containing protein n=1 Tax=Leptobacterium flavescens TaxID=472055 RepID=A0A6P0UPZ6_9FLAO|nr:transglutaminase domain-containing protein [Leptobacterium flavescens]NER15215.1 hypothetical protein [Leptobacterium flavescens]
MNWRILLFLFVFNFTYSQNFGLVDKKVKSYPEFEDVLNDLSIRIKNDFLSDEERVRAIFTWIATNIKYDVEKVGPFVPKMEWIVYSSKSNYIWERNRRDLRKVKKALKYGKGTCTEYSLIFRELCRKMEIPVNVIKGYTKTGIKDIGDKDRYYKDHAWNVVQIRGEWKIVDVTWAAGYFDIETNKFISAFDDFYFFTDPDEFITSHFPIQEKWQLNSKKVTKASFFATPIFFPDYYKNNFKLSVSDIGVLKTGADSKKIIISFDSLPKDKKIYYVFAGDKYVNHSRINRTSDNKFQLSIKYNEHRNSHLILFSEKDPILGFKIKPE